jgi:hypothetical protein
MLFHLGSQFVNIKVCYLYEMRRFLTDVHRKVYLAECIIKTDLKIRMGVSECVLYICSVNSKNVANKYAFI